MTLRDRFDLDRLAPYWQAATVWWSSRSLREQVLLGALAALGVFTLLLLFLAPLRASRNEALADIHGAALLEARLRNGGGGVAITRFRTGTSSAILTDSAAAAQITVTDIASEGTGVRAKLSDAPFDKVVNLIADVERSSPLRLRSLDIQRQGAAGFVTAELVFGQ